MASVGVYHIQDPVENFKIRIRIREVSNPYHGIQSASAASYEDEMIITWQEKVFGPRDILDYLSHKRSGQGLPSQLETRRYLSNLEKSGQDIPAMLSPVMLYSYINEEPYYPTKRQLLDVPDERETYLSHGSGPLSENSKHDERVMKVFNRWTRDAGLKTMHICLATDLDSKSLRSSSIFSSGPDISEKNLVSLSLTKSGLLIASPAFSQPITEDPRPRSDFGLTHDHSYDGSYISNQSIAPSIFLGDSVVDEASKKGFRLHTYRVRSDKGVDYEYTIENINGVISPIELEDLLQSERREDSLHAQQSRGKVEKAVGAEADDSDTSWKAKSFPAPYSRERTINLEIVSALGFGDGDAVYVKYEAQIPENWKCIDETKQSDADAISSSSTKKGALMSRPLTGITQISSPSDDAPFLRSLIVPSSTKASANTTLYHPRNIPPIFMSNDKIGRYLFGSCFMLVSIYSVALGPGYPLWIVPAMFFLLFLGYGSLATHPRVVFISKDGKQWEDGNTIAEPIAAFGHTTTGQFLINDGMTKFVAPSCTHLTIFFEVYSVSMFKRHTLEGCGYLTIPDLSLSPGGIEIRDVSTWKPVGDHHAMLNDFYLGGGVHLADMSCIAVPNKHATGLSKFGVRTQPSGSVRFKFSIVDSHKIAPKDDSGPGKHAAVGRRTVEDILSSYRNADLLNRSLSRMNVRSQANSPLRTPRSSLTNLAETPDEKSTPAGLMSFSTDRVADIIARARATTSGIKNDLVAEKKEKTGIAMTRKSAPGNANTFDTPGEILQQQSASLLGQDSEDEIELPSRRTGEPISLLDRFEASGITRKAPMPKSKGGSGVGGSNDRSEVDSVISSPMHSTPNTPLRERRPRYRDQGEGDDADDGEE